jgi:amidase
LDAHLGRIDLWNPVVNAIVTRTTESRWSGRVHSTTRSPAVRNLRRCTDSRSHTRTLSTPRDPHDVRVADLRRERTGGDEPFVTRLRVAGSVLVGKTNTPEFGAGSHTFNPVFGATGNPYDVSRSAGGSSGGAAAALATGMVPIADGSDLGGSLRNPRASATSVGFRPTLPTRIPRALHRRSDGANGSRRGAPVVGDVRRATPRDRWPRRRAARCVGADLWRHDPGRPGGRAIVDSSPSRLRRGRVRDRSTRIRICAAQGTRSSPTRRARTRRSGELLAEHRDRIKATVVWNIEQGLALDEQDIADAVDRMHAVRAGRRSVLR